MNRAAVALLCTVAFALAAIVLSRFIPSSRAREQLRANYVEFTERSSKVQEEFAVISRRIQYLEVQNHLLSRMVHEVAPGSMNQLGISPAATAPSNSAELDSNDVRAFALLHEQLRRPTEDGKPYLRQHKHRYPIPRLDPAAADNWKLTKRLQARLAYETDRGE